MEQGLMQQYYRRRTAKEKKITGKGGNAFLTKISSQPSTF